MALTSAAPPLFTIAVVVLIAAGPAAGQFAVDVPWSLDAQEHEEPLSSEHVNHFAVTITRLCPNQASGLPQAEGHLELLLRGEDGNDPTSLANTTFWLPSRTCLQEYQDEQTESIAFTLPDGTTGTQAVLRVVGALEAVGDDHPFSFYGGPQSDHATVQLPGGPDEATMQSVGEPEGQHREHLRGTDALLIMVVLAGFGWLLWAVRPEQP